MISTNFLAATAFEAPTTSTSVGVTPTTRCRSICTVTSLQNLDQKEAAVQKFTSGAHCHFARRPKYAKFLSISATFKWARARQDGTKSLFPRVNLFLPGQPTNTQTLHGRHSIAVYSGFDHRSVGSDALRMSHIYAPHLRSHLWCVRPCGAVLPDSQCTPARPALQPLSINTQSRKRSRPTKVSNAMNVACCKPCCPVP